MRKPDIYTREDSHFAEGPYKRLEICVSTEDPLLPLTELDKILQEYFPGVPREEIYFGHHWRTEGAGGKDFLMLVLQFNGVI